MLGGIKSRVPNQTTINRSNNGTTLDQGFHELTLLPSISYSAAQTAWAASDGGSLLELSALSVKFLYARLVQPDGEASMQLLWRLHKRLHKIARFPKYVGLEPYR